MTGRHYKVKAKSDKDAQTARDRQASRRRSANDSREIDSDSERSDLEEQTEPDQAHQEASGSQQGSSTQATTELDEPFLGMNFAAGSNAATLFTALTINDCNGPLEVGISAGVEAELTDELKLKVYVTPAKQGEPAAAKLYQDTLKMTLLGVAQESFNNRQPYVNYSSVQHM